MNVRNLKPMMEKKIEDIELKVYVLTTGYWPPYTPIQANIPDDMNEILEVFSKFYLDLYNGRRLIWQHSLGQCVLKASFPKGRKELSVSLFQTIVLMLYNDKESLTYSEIANATGIPDNELRRTLKSLAIGPARILSREEKGKFQATDSFKWRKDFQSKLKRIKLNQIQLNETKVENKKTSEDVFRDRVYQVDATIVRVMKTRKNYSHNQLMAELLHQIKFPVKPPDLKKRIESLIEREYIERDSEDPSVYNYLA